MLMNIECLWLCTIKSALEDPWMVVIQFPLEKNLIPRQKPQLLRWIILMKTLEMFLDAKDRGLMHDKI